MVTKVPQRIIASTGVTSGSYTNSNITVNESGQITSASSGTGGGASTDVPKISNLQVTNSSWTVLDDTAVDVLGGYVLLTGVNFVSGCLVYIGQTPANSVAFVSSTTVRVTLPAVTAGTYPVYLVNPDGGVAIRVPGVTISASPSWQTASSLADQYDATAISLQLLATDATSYSISSGSLPPGLTMNSSGLISGTVTTVTVDTTYTFTVVATDAQLQDSPRTFTVTITVSDPYFKLTTLLLTGNSGNNIVTDASTNNFPITVVGDSRASSFSPYLTGWSNYFDGTGDYLDIPTNAAFDFGTGDFTIECWAYLTSSVAYAGIITSINVAGANPSWLLGFTNTADQLAFCPSYFDAAVTFSYTGYYNKWTHIAVTRSGTTLRLFANGILVSSATNSTTISTGGKSIRIGTRYQNDPQYLIVGYLSNLHVVKGTALYTANFTPATTTLTAVAGTSLLTCHANRLVDSSTNNFAITKSGDVRVDSFNPFGLTNSGTTGSMYFDGTGDYLTWAGTTIGANPFCFETWVYFTGGFASIQALLGIWVNAVTGDLSIRVNSATQICFDRSGVSATNFTVPTLTNNQWYHIVACRDAANNSTIFVNGIRSSTGVVADSYAYSKTTSIAGLYSGVPYHVTGYMSNTRLIVGSTPYDPTQTTLTVPTAPLTAVTNTSLLTLQNRQPHNNHSFQDSSSNNFLITRNGNATQGTFSPFSQSGWSNYFGSSTANFKFASDASFAIGTGNFSIECFVNFAAWSGTSQRICIQGVSGTTNIQISKDSGANDLFVDIQNSRVITYAWTPTLGQWYHIAVVRSGTGANQVALYIGGTSVATGTSSASIAQNQFVVGGLDWASGYSLQGYISNFLYSNVARTITVPTSAYTSDVNTLILTCQSNRFVDNSATPKAITAINGSPSVQAFSPFAPTATYSPVTHGGSAYFDRTGDFLSLGNNNSFNFSGNFTVELWYYPLAYDDIQIILSGTSNYQFGYSANDSRNLYYYGSSGNTISGTPASSMLINQWNHIVLVRSGTTLSIMSNGVRQGTATHSSSVNFSGSTTIGGYADSTTSYAIRGYLAGFRAVNGVAVYDPTQTTYTVPTAPLTNTTTTSLLLNFTNDAIEDATGRNVIETVADARTTSAVSKWTGKTSMYFDGTGDYAILPATQTPFFLISGLNWTVECWYYKLSSSLKVLFTCGPANAGNANRGWSFSLDPANSIVYLSSSGADNAFTGVTIPINSWNHIAYVYTTSNTTLRVYLNGNLVGTKANPVLSNPSVASGDRFTVGATYAGATNWDGYIADLRWTTGHARYTANFTPPTASLRLK
jgi:hypothetical protein